MSAHGKHRSIDQIRLGWLVKISAGTDGAVVHKNDLKFVDQRKNRYLKISTVNFLIGKTLAVVDFADN